MATEKKKRILLFPVIYTEPFPLDCIVDRPVDYRDFERLFVAGGGNSGNKLFLSATEQYLTSDNISYDRYYSGMSIEYINESYDMCVWAAANVFGIYNIKWVESYLDLTARIKIPIYVLGIGLQCKSYEQMDQLVRDTKYKVSKLCENIYNSGGEFGLRGYLTKEYLDKVCENTAVVTGCPSLYQNGRDLKIDVNNIKNRKAVDLNIGVNGRLNNKSNVFLVDIMEEFPGATFFDQYEFASFLYTNQMHKATRLSKMYSRKILNLLKNSRVRLIYDLPCWIGYLNKNIDFSIGCRIHGNIAAILAGVPAYIMCPDERIRELAEFFDIPHETINHELNQEKVDLDKIIEKLDYSKFNSNFKKKYDNFEAFLKKCGIRDDGISDKTLWENKIKKQNWDLPPDINYENIDRHISFYDNLANRLQRECKDKSIYLYGAGYECQFFINELGYADLLGQVKGVFDSDKKKSGSTIDRFVIEEVDIAKLKDAEIIIITTLGYEEEIWRDIVRMNIDKEKIFKLSDLLHINTDL